MNGGELPAGTRSLHTYSFCRPPSIAAHYFSHYPPVDYFIFSSACRASVCPTNAETEYNSCRALTESLRCTKRDDDDDGDCYPRSSSTERTAHLRFAEITWLATFLVARFSF